MRDHQAIVIEEFNGLFSRDGADSTPPDHFSSCSNIQFIHSGFRTRDGLDTYAAYPKIVRIYNYVQPTGDSLLLLDDAGNLFHDHSPTPFVPILSIAAMTDFAFVSINGYAYITPNDSNTGLQNEYVYVYKGDGTAARRAGGNPPVTAPIAASNGPGSVEIGYHIFAVVFETDTGYLTAPGVGVALNCPGATSVDLSSIEVAASSSVTARRIVATAAIDPDNFTGDLTGYQFFFVPNGRIADNTTTTLNVDFYDADLLDDASHLLDNFAFIPAGVNIVTYHGRMVVMATYTDISLAYISYPGEPEAVNQVSGFIIAPLDGNPITNANELRDVLYVFKRVRTYAYSDNGGEPSSWPLTIIDQGIGASIHGIATVLDSGGTNIDFLVIVDYSGIMLFNGSYARPELTWKIKTAWGLLQKNQFPNIQIVNDTISQVLFMTVPGNQMLIADYSNGMDWKNIRFSPWRFDIQTSSIALIEINKLIIASVGSA